MNRKDSIAKLNKVNQWDVVIIGEIGYTDQDFRVILKDLFEEWRSELINSIDIGKKRGEIKQEINSSATAISLICAFEGVRGVRKIYDDDDIFDEFLESMGLFINSLSV
jgi:TetR/AcrR family transcriptional repressor of nem operon